MKKHLAILGTGLLLVSAAHSAVLATWTIEPGAPADLTNSTTSPVISASTGTGTLSGTHADPATDWSTPAGNGSTDSLSSNTWGVGDYYQFVTSSLGESGITVTFDQTGSNTGPRDFQFSYSVDGSTFTNFGAVYQLINGSWSAGTPVATTSFSFDLSSVTALDNQASIYFRITQATTTAINGTTVATAGTGRVDNISVVSVPEPVSAVLGAIGLLGILRRRR